MIAKFVIYGSPAVLKNNKQIVMLGKRPMLIPSKKARAYEKMALPIFKKIWGDREPINKRIHLKFTFYVACREDSKNSPDLSNLYEMPQDLMTKAGIIEDDRLVCSHDGSRIIKMCSLRCPARSIIKSGKRKGELKDSCGAVKKCPYERTDIEVYSFDEQWENINTFREE